MTGPELPFLALARAHLPAPAERPAKAAPADAPAPVPETAPREVDALFEASVSGVQTVFRHLSKADIAHPPHQWFDAALARQIAIHIAIRRFDVPLRRIARELERNRASVKAALQTVDERLKGQDFADSYRAMAQTAEQALKTPNDEEQGA